MTTKIIPEIKRFDASVQDKYNDIKARQRELSARLRAVEKRIKEIRSTRAAAISRGEEHKPHSEQLADLRVEVEGLTDAIELQDHELERLQRYNVWLHK